MDTSKLKEPRKAGGMRINQKKPHSSSSSTEVAAEVKAEVSHLASQLASSPPSGSPVGPPPTSTQPTVQKHTGSHPKVRTTGGIQQPR